MLLSELEPGNAFTVSRVLSGGEIGKRLADMGFTEGAEGTLIRGAFMRGPLQVSIRGYDLLIRRGEGKLIEVERMETAGGSAETRSEPRTWEKSRMRRFLVSLFSEPDCCGGRRNGKRGRG